MSHLRKYCSDKCGNSYRIRVIRIRRKKWAVDHKGGACQKCGYKKSLDALVFHHRNDKKFELSSAWTYNLKTLQSELDKCRLLCANCHAEEHAIPPSFSG